MTAAISATQMQMAVARDVLLDPADPRYEWALKFMEVYGSSGLRARRAERGRFHEATASRERKAESRKRRAAELASEGWTLNAIRVQVAVEEGHPAFPFHRRTVQRWLNRGDISTP